MDPTLDAALREANYLYVTTYGASGKSGTVPVWIWYDGRAAYFTTRRESLKARRIRNTGRVTVMVLVLAMWLGLSTMVAREYDFPKRKLLKVLAIYGFSFVIGIATVIADDLLGFNG